MMNSSAYSGSWSIKPETKPVLFEQKMQLGGWWIKPCKGIFFAVFISLTLFLLSACSTTYAPVEQRGSSYSKKKYSGKIPAYHVVRKGDTLYSIAWRYGLDYKQLAVNNRIWSPYRIYAGQKLRLSSRAKKNSVRTKVSSRSGRKTSSKQTSSKKSSSKKIITSHKTRSNKSTKYKSSAKRGNTTKAGSKNRTATFTGSKRLKWIWPVKGKIIQRYSPGSGKKGIDISAPRGTLIKSAEAGKVVYSGQGLVGYGRLIIIKHNDTYLSAYAHNQQLLVNEGQLVNKGQGIARLGRSGTNRYKLHFEIRKNGKPVNPMSYLPR